MIFGGESFDEGEASGENQEAAALKRGVAGGAGA